MTRPMSRDFPLLLSATLAYPYISSIGLSGSWKDKPAAYQMATMAFTNKAFFFFFLVWRHVVGVIASPPFCYAFIFHHEQFQSLYYCPLVWQFVVLRNIILPFTARFISMSVLYAQFTMYWLCIVSWCLIMEYFVYYFRIILLKSLLCYCILSHLI